jgi:hypothetical protein
MRKVLLLCAALSLMAGTAGATHDHSGRKSGGYEFSVSTGDSESFECSQALKVKSRDLPAAQYGEETQTLANLPLRLEAARNGGIAVRTHAGSGIEVKLCKAALAETDAEALQLLNQVYLQVSGSTVTARGPDEKQDSARWATLLLVRAPAGATLDLNAHNGGVSLRDFRGRATARTTNGGISLKNVSGDVDATTTNGGISVQESRGNVKVTARNGGLSLKLGEGWQAGTLSAQTQNGGVMVEVARNFQSSLEVALLGHGGLSCDSAVCSGAQQSREGRQRVIRVGSSEPVVRASTVNGGVVIRDPDSRRRSRMF